MHYFIEVFLFQILLDVRRKPERVIFSRGCYHTFKHVHSSHPGPRTSTDPQHGPTGCFERSVLAGRDTNPVTRYSVPDLCRAICYRRCRDCSTGHAASSTTRPARPDKVACRASCNCPCSSSSCRTWRTASCP